jgi:riboflavin synthase alpha subunit
MFTGLVEEIGRVLERDGARLVVGADRVLQDSELGASVAVNGACLTVVERGPGRLRFDMGPETLARTALADLAAGHPVNLERPMRLGGPVGGHLVQGHVDGVGIVAALTRQAETARLTIEWRDRALAPLLIPQGSVAVDGVSLTVARLKARDFEIMIIPHTLAATTLGDLRKGQRVNLEMDMIGKYVQRVLRVRAGRGEPQASRADMKEGSGQGRPSPKARRARSREGSG